MVEPLFKESGGVIMYATMNQLNSWLDGNTDKEIHSRADLRDVLTWLNGETNQGVDKELIAKGHGRIVDHRKLWRNIPIKQGHPFVNWL